MASVLRVRLSNGKIIDIPALKDKITEADKNEIKEAVLAELPGGGGSGLTEEQAADLAANTEARHTHENKDTLDRFGNLPQTEYPFPTENDTPTYNGTGLWTTEHGQVIADVSKDNETGDWSFELRKYPQLDEETNTVHIKQHFKTSELENDSGFITADDIPEANNITPEQTTFFEFLPANNLLDATTKQVGMLNNDGKLYTGGSYDNYRYFEQYIPVNEGDVISFQHTDKNGTRYTTAEQSLTFPRIAAYDSEKQILKTLGAMSTSTNKVYMYTVPETVRYIRITLPSAIDNWTELAVVKNIYNVVPYEEYGTNSKVQLKPEYIPEKKNTVLAFLPDEICCAVGRTIEIYNNQVCPTAEKYHFRWVCDIGKPLGRKFSITGTEALIGDYDLILEIYDDEEACMYSKTSKLKVVAGTIADNVSICPIGDSLTNGKYWLNEVQTLSENKVSYVGTRGNTEGVKHEGRSGFTSKGYLTAQTYDFENEGVHPFWNGTEFSWEYYKTNNGINPTAVQIFLGTNDLFGNTTAETFTENIKTMVDNIRSTDTNIPIFVVLTILVGSQNGLGKQQSTDGFTSYKGKYKYNLDCKFIGAMNLLYDTLKDYANLYFVPLTECHDNEYNFGAVETPVNPRASQTEYMPNEGIHPQQQGYEQMADIMYSVYCRAFVSQ